MLLLSVALAHDLPTESSSGDFTVMTWNVWGLPWPLSKDRGERLSEVPSELERADIVGIQEAWSGALKWLDSPLVLPQEQPGDSGLALAGDLCGEASRALFHPFTVRTGSERFKRKGILETDVVVDGVRVRVYNTHLQHGSRSAPVRSAQIAQLLQLLQEHDLPSVVLGDFNFYNADALDQETEQVMAGVGLRDVASELARPQATFRFDNRYAQRSGLEEGRERFDRVYVRDGAEARIEARDVDVLRYRNQPLSDHQPVRAELRLHPRP